MRRSARRLTQIGPEERLARAVSGLPRGAQRALADVADREDLPLVAGSWNADDGGCLVANVVRASGVHADAEDMTLDLRMLELFPEMSSRDLNHLIVAWDEAALQEGRDNDAALRRLLRGALARAGVPVCDGLPDDLQTAELEVRPGPPAGEIPSATGGAPIRG